MARSNGPFGPPGTRAPLRRHAGDDPFAAPQPAHNGQWQAPDYPDPAQVHPGQASHGYHFPPPEPDPNYGQHQALPPQQQWGGQPDPRGYDLGNYMPSGTQPYPQGDPGGPYQQGPYSSQFTATHDGYAETDNYGEEFLEEEDEPRRGRRWIFIAAALVGAIGIGGAMAYTYKSIVAPNSGRVPLVKAGDPNVKVRPDNRGDRKAARADERPAAPPQQERPAEEGGPRKVRTIPIVPGEPPAAEEASGPAPLPGMPGIMLDNAHRPPQAQPPPRETAPSRVVIGRPPLPQPTAAEPEDPPPARKPPVQVVPPVAAKPPPVVAAAPAAAPRPKATTAAASATGAGYVAVLSSQKTRVDALKKFADLQQKHADVLNGKTPDVQEADLSARGLGTMYRLVVGPPGSREAASGICSQLRTAGQDCWVKEY